MGREGKNLKRIPRKSLATQSRQYAYIQEVTRVSDGEGGFTTGWANTTASKLSMSITTLTAKQLMEFNSINVEATHLVKIAFEIPVTELNQILYGTRELEILSVEDIQERGILNWVFCKERRS